LTPELEIDVGRMDAVGREMTPPGRIVMLDAMRLEVFMFELVIFEIVRLDPIALL
jgi:hypothetical protein